MARNRKSESATIRFGPAIKAGVICLLIGGSGVGYVWQKEQIVKLSKERERFRAELQRSEDTNEKLRKQLAVMQGAQFLVSKIKELNLGLIPQQQTQVWRLPEPVADASPLPHQFPLQASRPLPGH